MARKPILINASRGGLVDEHALVEALDQNQISGVGLDVLSAEPLDANHPLPALAADRPNVLITPHVAWASENGMARLWQLTIDNVDQFLEGRPTNVVT